MDKILEEQKKFNFGEMVGIKSKGLTDQKTIRDIELGSFSTREKTEFYDRAYGDLLFDYFTAWLSTSYNDKEGREFIYNSAQVLGDLRNKLANYETLKNNIEYVKRKDNE